MDEVRVYYGVEDLAELEYEMWILDCEEAYSAVMKEFGYYEPEPCEVSFD